MKKDKPPPGATLIARLKEQRLAREAELAKRKEEASGTQPASTPAAESKPEPKPEPQPPSSKQPEPTTEVVEAVVQRVDATIVVQSPADMKQAISVSAKQHTDLIHREIDIEDLRPHTDDYYVLTDEIRLAGRFAAVGLIAQGLRLYKLKEVEIYKQHYQTFEEYCRKEHQMSATYAYRLIRMAEMAEQVARLGHSPVSSSSDNMPDPFEVMISLGHRHLMALLPLETQTAQELLVKGIPVSPEDADKRVPLSQATEKQIRAALKGLSPSAEKTVVRVTEKRALVSEKQLIPALSKLVEMLEDWALWLDGEPPGELEAARMGRGQLLNRLAKRFRTASGKIADALEGEEEQ